MMERVKMRRNGHYRVNYKTSETSGYRSKSYRFGEDMASEHRALTRAIAFADEQYDWYIDKFTHEIMRKRDRA